MTEMGFFVLGFTVSLAILVVADAVVQTVAAEAKRSWPPMSRLSSRARGWLWLCFWRRRKNEQTPSECAISLRRGHFIAFLFYVGYMITSLILAILIKWKADPDVW